MEQHLLALLLLLVVSLTAAFPVPPPLPLLPIPSASQLSWQLGEMALLIHFGPNTFTGDEWGTGRTDPSVFDPVGLDARQWARTAASAGFSRAVLTVKHHDGFCLWPSAYTNYSVRSSPFRGGAGDVVAEFADAARAEGIQIGIYLSPWDRHDSSFGDTLKYNEYYLAQMTELLTGYGEIKEVWLDGAKGEGEKDMEYLFESWFELIHQLQPGAMIFSDAGPDIRYPGVETGVAGTTCWSLFNSSSVVIGGTGTDISYSNTGDPSGHDWIPPECDVSIRSGWFWSEEQTPKTAIDLLEIYYTSVGRNCALILNVPPNTSGLIADEDLRVLREFTRIRRAVFFRNLAGGGSGSSASASSTRGGPGDPRFSAANILSDGISAYWAPKEFQSEWVIEVDLGETLEFNVVQIQEPIQMGQRVVEFHVEVLPDGSGGGSAGAWEVVAMATTIGYKRLLKFPIVRSRFLKVVVDKSRADPLIAFVGVYLDPFSEVRSGGDFLRRPLNSSSGVDGSKAVM